MPSINEGMPNALLEALGVGLACMGSNIPGIKGILHYEELMFDPLEVESLLQKIQGFFSDRQFFDKVKRLCQERKDVFVFDWEERVFEMITGTPTSLIK
jgi:glycosyltransferase involved in cell wall biosynthesis